MSLSNRLILRSHDVLSYHEVSRRMADFTDTRGETTPDECWLLQHEPVFTQGQAGKQEHLLDPGNIPVMQSDRGGQITYHGPGQLVCYLLIDLKRRHLGVRKMVDVIENSIIDLLTEYDIEAHAKREAPGVYVGGKKIAALGLRIRRGCSYHGLSLNIDMDLEPFSRINPCGYAGLEVTDLAHLGIHEDFSSVSSRLVTHLVKHFGYDSAAKYKVSGS